MPVRMKVRRKIRGKVRYLLPNSFTAFSLVLGLASIFFTLDGKLVLAAWIILWCTLLDKLDGMAARLVNATSDFGVEFDSFADFVAFGLAPGFLVYQHAISAPSLPFLLALEPEGGLIWFFRISVSFYVLCAGIRLATFNVRTASIGPEWFQGLPSTFCGALIASLLLTVHKYTFFESVVPWMPIVLIPLGLLMLAPIVLPKVKARRSRYFNLFQGLLGGMIYLFGLLRKFPEMLFVFCLTYMIGGFIYGLIYHRRKPPVERQTQVDGVGESEQPTRDAEQDFAASPERDGEVIETERSSS